MNLKDALTAVFVIMLWSSNLIMQKLSLDHISPYLMNALRFSLMAPLLLLYPKPPFPVKKLFVCGLFWNVLNFSFSGLGLKLGVGAGVAALIFQTVTFFGVGFAFFLLKERSTPVEIVGLLIAFCGVWIILSCSMTGDGSVTGVLCILLSAAACGCGNVLLKKLDGSFGIDAIVWLSVLSAVPLTFLALLMDGPQGMIDQVYAMDWTCIRYVLCAAYGSTFLGGYLWCGLLSRNRVTNVTPFMLLTPFFASLLSYIVIEEVLGAFEISGGAVIISGLALVQLYPWAFARSQSS